MPTHSAVSIKKEMVIEASQQTAFEVFTEKMDLWWPRTHHVGSSDMTGMVVEPFVNGRWYSTHADGQESQIGYVQTYRRYDLFVLVWQINGDFKIDPNLKTEVVTEFIPEGPKRTRIRFEHKDLQKLGGGKAIASMDQGWGQIITLYKNVVERHYSVLVEIPLQPDIVFARLLDVSKWWSKDFEGHSSKTGDEFTIHHPGRHFSKQKLMEVIPDKKLVWLVTESRLDWLERDPEEWSHTRMIFTLAPNRNGTILTFTHEGLTPEKEGYEKCSQGWNRVIKEWLPDYITKGKTI